MGGQDPHPVLDPGVRVRRTRASRPRGREALRRGVVHRRPVLDDRRVEHLGVVVPPLRAFADDHFGAKR